MAPWASIAVNWMTVDPSNPATVDTVATLTNESIATNQAAVGVRRPGDGADSAVAENVLIQKDFGGETGAQGQLWQANDYRGGVHRDLDGIHAASSLGIGDLKANGRHTAKASGPCEGGEAKDIVDTHRYSSYLCRQNYPNPFNPATTIPFAVGGYLPAKVRLDIYDLLGQRIRTVVDDVLGAGPHLAHWDGRDDRGGEVASGIYLYSLRVIPALSRGGEATGTTAELTRRLLLIR
jgi:hypothetical protein